MREDERENADGSLFLLSIGNTVSMLCETREEERARARKEKAKSQTKARRTHARVCDYHTFRNSENEKRVVFRCNYSACGVCQERKNTFK